jgi:phosphoglycolate phosphatase
MAAHLLFDFDGTLVDSAPGILAAFEAALKSRGLAPVIPLHASLIGPPLHETLRRISGIRDVDAIEALAHAFRNDYDEHSYRHTVAYPGVDAALRSLHARGTSLYIVTNKRMLPTRRILDHLGWTSLFADVFTLDGVAPAAGDKAELLGRLLASRDIDAGEALMIGDTPADGLAAASNGVAFVAAHWGYGVFDTMPADVRPLHISADIAGLA